MTRMRRLAEVAAILIGLAIPAGAVPSANRVVSVEHIMQDAATQIRPYAAQRQITLSIEGDACRTMVDETERTRCLELLANAAAMAPAASELKVRLVEGSVGIWIPNASVGFSVDRTVDGRFRLRSVAGRGTELSLKLDRPAVCNK